MVSTAGDRALYSGGTDGAPPTPPPGGYRAARRVPAAPPLAQAGVAPSAPQTRPSPASWIALGVAALFAFVLLIMWAAGATGAIYGVGTLVVQLAVLIAVVAIVVSPRGRRLGSIALAIVLLVNVGTIGAASAVSHPPAAAPVVDPLADHWAAYPGLRDVDADEILAQTSLEDATQTGDALLAAIRARLTDRFGYSWVEGVPGTIRHERNGYGGESMLVSYDSVNWATTEAIPDHEQKLAVMDAIDGVLAENAFSYLYPLNDPAGGFDPDFLTRLYGSADIRTQSVWEWVGDDYPGPIRVYATLTDLTHDDGTFRAAREGQVGDSGEPIEGLRISIYIPEVLSEADVDEFIERMADYPY